MIFYSVVIFIIKFSMVFLNFMQAFWLPSAIVIYWWPESFMYLLIFIATMINTMNTDVLIIYVFIYFHHHYIYIWFHRYHDQCDEHRCFHTRHKWATKRFEHTILRISSYSIDGHIVTATCNINKTYSDGLAVVELGSKTVCQSHVFASRICFASRSIRACSWGAH